MPKAIDITGNRYGRLKVLSKAENIGRHTAWNCLCDCGNTKVVKTTYLQQGITKSCGCWEIENRGPKDVTCGVSDADMIGKQFGRLKVVEYIGKDSNRSKLFKCVCECGKETVTRKEKLVSGMVNSCGCLSSEFWSKLNYKHGYARKGQYNRKYAIYSHMRDRCHNPNNPAYKNYGARGIFVCDEWLNNPDAFMEWADNSGYSDNLSIDRIDNNKGYSPNNCRWATDKEQARNKRNNVLVECNGEKHTLSEWAEIIGIRYRTLEARRLAGWSDERIILEPLHNNKGGDFLDSRVS